MSTVTPKQSCPSRPEACPCRRLKQRAKKEAKAGDLARPVKPAAARAKEAEIRGKNPSKGGGPIRGKNPAMRVLPRAASGSKQRSTRVARVMVEVSIQSPQSGAASQSNMMEVVASSSQGNQGEESSTPV